MKQVKILILISLLCSSAYSQVTLKEKIVLDGTASTDRQVTGLSYPQSPTSAANANSFQSGALIYGLASGTNQLSLNFSPALTQYVQGMTINFKTSSANTGPVTIEINGLGQVPLRKNGSFPIDSLDLSTGQLVSAIYDGTAFQVLSKLNRRCPAGFADVNKDFCIELAERDTVNWFSAVKTCGDMNARLCTQSEWVYACQKSGVLNLLNMIDNMEWVDSGGNDPDNAKTMGEDVNGLLGCNQGVTQLWSANRSYRCCYSK